MTRSSCGKAFLTAAALVLAAAGAAFACFGTVPPFAAIKYDAAEAAVLHGQPEALDKAHPVLLLDVEANDASHWLESTVTQLTTLRAYAHAGFDWSLYPADPNAPGAWDAAAANADARVSLIQIWGWKDTNGNGAADEKDTTTQWVKLFEITPATGDGHAVGWKLALDPLPAIVTSTWQGDLLQGHAIPLKAGESWLLLIRVVDILGNTSLMSEAGGAEKWDSGIPEGPGSGVTEDRYVDHHGNTPGTADARIKDRHIVWVYVPRLK